MYAPDAPDKVKTEGVIRLVGYLAPYDDQHGVVSADPDHRQRRRAST